MEALSVTWSLATNLDDAKFSGNSLADGDKLKPAKFWKGLKEASRLVSSKP